MRWEVTTSPHGTLSLMVELSPDDRRLAHSAMDFKDRAVLKMIERGDADVENYLAGFQILCERVRAAQESETHPLSRLRA